ncbi:MAG: RNA polymerase sigma factor FliA [Phycisphaerae bacterium]|nr:RNA polymerase sigma factor FliA [Phycisphaerae bacterium]
MSATRIDSMTCQENRLWGEFGRRRDHASRNRLLEHYLPVVRYHARQLFGGLSDEVELDDLVSSGTMGLIRAIETFDPGMGFKFETYCGPRIRGAMIDELRSMDWAPRLVRYRARRWNEASDELRGRLGRVPTDAELMAELNVPPREFRKLKRDAQTMHVASLSSMRIESGSEDDDIAVGDVVADPSAQAPEQGAVSGELRGLIMRGLTRAERLLVLLYYYEEMTMKEIGATLDLSESRVSQMHTSILERLRRKLDRTSGGDIAA